MAPTFSPLPPVKSVEIRLNELTILTLTPDEAHQLAWRLGMMAEGVDDWQGFPLGNPNIKVEVYAIREEEPTPPPTDYEYAAARGIVLLEVTKTAYSEDCSLSTFAGIIVQNPYFRARRVRAIHLLAEIMDTNSTVAGKYINQAMETSLEAGE